MNAFAFAHALLGTAWIALLAKTTVILALAPCAALVLRRASAARRHLMWLTALVAAAGLVLLSPVTPSLVIRQSLANVEPQIVETRVRMEAPRRPVLSGTTRVSNAGTVTPQRQSTIALAWVVAHATTLASALWFLGSLVVLIRCVAGHVALARLVRQSRPVTSVDWVAALEAVSADAGVRCKVEIVTCDRVLAPATSGFLHPVILLPADAHSWTDQRRRAVLVHELGHVARADYAAQLVGTFACALLWFHPLAWLAAARLRAEAENAADDCVLAAGVPSIAYAYHLLELAQIESGFSLASAGVVSMADARHLERRFRAMLDSSRSRTPVSSRLQTLAGSLTLAAMIPLSGLRTGTALNPPTRLERELPQPAMIKQMTTSAMTSSIPAESRAETSARRRAPAVAVGLGGAAVTAVQTAPAATVPDFSGTWVLDTITNAEEPTRMQAFMSTIRARSIGLTIVIDQTPSSMNIRRTFWLSCSDAVAGRVRCRSFGPENRPDAAQHPESLVYSARVALDGSPTKGHAWGDAWGDGKSIETSITSAWEGSTLATTTRSEIDGREAEVVDRWSLGADGKTVSLVQTVRLRGDERLMDGMRYLAAILPNTTLVFRRQ